MKAIRMDFHKVVREVEPGVARCFIELTKHDPDEPAPAPFVHIEISPLEARWITSVVSPSPYRKGSEAIDLLLPTIEALGGTVQAVFIAGYKDTRDNGWIHIRRENGERRSIPCRPSIAIGISLMAKAFIYANQDAFPPSEAEKADAAEQERQAFDEFRSFLENLTPDYFEDGSDE